MEARKVFCIGFHKTGTSSMGAALELLGLRVAGPFGVHAPRLPERVEDEALVRAERYDAVQDNPWPLLYRSLDERFPGSRFVLTVRAEDEWLASVLAHFGGRSTPMREWIYGDGAGDPVDHEAVYLERFRRHNDEVRAHFADRPADLLEMDLGRGDGWAELCGFLGETAPDRPFPHANEGTPLRRAANRLRAGVLGRFSR